MVESTTSEARASALVTETGRRLNLRPFEDVLPLLVKDVEAWFGRRARLVPVFVAERPFSHVMRAGIWHDGDSGPREHLFIKVSKPKIVDGSPNGMRNRVERDFAVTERVFSRMAEGPGYSAVRPMACYPAHLAIVTAEVPGETLLALLQRQLRWAFSPARADDLTGLLTATGRWVRAFQEPSSETFTSASMEEYIDHRLRQLAATGREGTRLRGLVLAHIHAIAGRLDGPVRKVTVHADLSPSNVIVSSGRVVVLDFAMARLGHPLQDVARLFTQIELLAMKPQFRRSVIAPLQQALVRGFDPALDIRDPAFRLQILAQRVNHLASLSIRRYFGLEAIYNRLVRRQHVAWIEHEAAGGGWDAASWA